MVVVVGYDRRDRSEIYDPTKRGVLLSWSQFHLWSHVPFYERSHILRQSAAAKRSKFQRAEMSFWLFGLFCFANIILDQCLIIISRTRPKKDFVIVYLPVNTVRVECIGLQSDKKWEQQCGHCRLSEMPVGYCVEHRETVIPKLSFYLGCSTLYFMGIWLW